MLPTARPLASHLAPFCLLIAHLVCAASLQAAPTYAPVFGSPAASATTDWSRPLADHDPTNWASDAGLAVGWMELYVGSSWKGQRALRWGRDVPASQLQDLGRDGSTHAHAINPAGIAVGQAPKSDAAGQDAGTRAVRWNVATNQVEELGHLGFLSFTSLAYAAALAINPRGDAVGYSFEPNAFFSGDNRPTRWLAGQTTPTRLPLPPPPTAGSYRDVVAFAISPSGAVLGRAEKSSIGSLTQSVPVRWNPEGTTAVELEPIYPRNEGSSGVDARAINDAGTVVGFAWKKDTVGNDGERAVRWHPDSTRPVELQTLGTSATGWTRSQAHDINASGVVVGWANRYDASGTLRGARPVKWDAAGVATELGDLGLSPTGVTEGRAVDVTDSGAAVGQLLRYDNGVGSALRAVYWQPDGTAIDLNDLIDPASGWRLLDAFSITENGWIAGHGQFTHPTGDIQERLFLLQVPEPASATLAMLALSTLLCRRPRHRHA